MQRCIMCNDSKIHAKEMCRVCYDKLYTKIERCKRCKRLRKIVAKGMCRKCYDEEQNYA